MTARVGAAARRRQVAAGAINAHDPGYDQDGRIAHAAIDVALALSGSARRAEPA